MDTCLEVQDAPRMDFPSKPTSETNRQTRWRRQSAAQQEQLLGSVGGLRREGGSYLPTVLCVGAWQKRCCGHLEKQTPDLMLNYFWLPASDTSTSVHICSVGLRYGVHAVCLLETQPGILHTMDTTDTPTAPTSDARTLSTDGHRAASVATSIAAIPLPRRLAVRGTVFRQ